VLLGKSYWQGLLTWMEEVMLANGCINHLDLKLITLVDSVDEAAHIIIEHYRKHVANQADS
jgi:predicted Rossmann-fold nucleotide-binding protein